jgi:lysophospholipase L1-like esterase
MKNLWNKTKYLLLIIFFFSYCSVPPTGIIILCAGDSITEAEYPLFLDKILRKNGLRAKVLNYGRSGFTSGEYLNFLKENKDTLAAEQPDFILLQLGTNDVRVDHDSTPREEFYSNMKEIIKIFKDFRNRSGEKSEILLALIPPIPEASLFPFTLESHTRVTEEINPCLKKVSGEEKVILVDNYTPFVQSPHLLPEVHPSREGYRHLAQNWYAALKPLLSNKALE